ncbi:SWIM zinc finger family protein [Candidatus Acetothermia bacterium]|nr:SWIM zinc finger family protein [Candidatus Acetothermia bacterium]MBI3644178.1 SWIM zinc finger family protein [Candidatus Acetothermia bacterium]
MTTREQKGLQIAATTKLRKTGQTWLVPSQSGKGTYEVVLDKQCPTCTCPDHEQRKVKCKHILAVEYTFSREQNEDGTTTVTEKIQVTYGQD